MRRLALCVVFLGCAMAVGAPAPFARPERSSEAKKHWGTWEIVSDEDHMVSNSIPGCTSHYSSRRYVAGRTLVVTGARFEWRDHDQAVQMAESFCVGSGTSGQVDLSRGHSSVTRRGIWKREGDVLTLFVGSQRPKSFDVWQNGRLLVLRRK